MLAEIVTDNQRAKQTMNTMYLDQTGAKSKVSVIQFFSKGAIPFQVFSIIFSAFGFYFDLLDGFGAIGAIAVGVFLGLFIEGSKHYFVKGAFTSFSPIWKMIMAGGAFIFLVIALTYHYKSLTTFQNISVRGDLKEQVNRETETLNKKLDAISATQANNKALTFVFGNGTSRDDKEATESILSNNQLAMKLASMGNETSSAAALLRQSEKTAKQNTNTLLFLFITVELFSLFGLIAKGLIGSETSEAVKSVVTTSEKLTTLEENVVQVVETKLINDTMQKIEEAVKVNNSPTLTPANIQSGYNQPNPTQIGFNANTTSKPYFMGALSGISQIYKKPSNLTVLPSSNAHSLGALHRKEEATKERGEQNITSDKKEVADLLKFDHKENQIMKIMWENGQVKEGDKLIPKRLVKLELKAERLITHSEIDKLYEKLEEQGHIVFKNGYRALTEIENITMVQRKGE
jgi:hypothetical protein